MFTLIRIAVMIAAVVIVMHVLGYDLDDVRKFARNNASEFRPDAKDLPSGGYADRVANKLRDEAANIRSPGVAEDISAELNRELAAERRRVMEQRAQAAQQITGKMLSGDVETLKQVYTKRRLDPAGP